MKKVFHIFIFTIFMVIVFHFVSQAAPIDINRTISHLKSVINRGNVMAVSSSNSGCCVLRGDLDGNGFIDINDLTLMVCCSFGFGFCQNCSDICFEHFDVDQSGGVDISDIVYMVSYMFGGGPAPLPC